MGENCSKGGEMTPEETADDIIDILAGIEKKLDGVLNSRKYRPNEHITFGCDPSEGSPDNAGDLGDTIQSLQRARVRKLLRDNGFSEDALD